MIKRLGRLTAILLPLLVAAILALPFLAALFQPVSPDQAPRPTLEPTATMIPAPTLEPPATVTAVIIVPTAIPVWTLPPTEKVTPQATTTRVPSEFNTPAPTATKPAVPVQVPR